MSLIHRLTNEGSGFQRRTLYLLARRLELPFLRVSYNLMRGKWRGIGARRSVRALYAAAVTRPIATHGDSARPIPFEPLADFIRSLDCSIAVGPCRCRITHRSCNHPLETDIVIRTGAEAWRRAFPKEYRAIDREEALRIISECHAAGMFHMIFHHFPSTSSCEYVVCNCCTCGCVPYILNRDLGPRNFPFISGGWTAETNLAACGGHGDCTAACPFGARSVSDGKAVTRACFGCGLCVAACPEKAIRMVHSHDENPAVKHSLPQ